MTATTQAPPHGARFHRAHRRRLGGHPRPDPLGAPALVRPRGLRGPDRPRGQLEAHAGRPHRAAVRGCRDRRSAGDAPSSSTSMRPTASRSASRRVGESPPRRGLRARGPLRGDRVDAHRRGAATCASRRTPSSTTPVVVTMTGAGADRRAHAHIVLEAGVELPRHVLLAPRRLGPVRAERRDHRARRRPPRASSPCSSGTTTRCTRHPIRRASSATPRSATSSSASAAASCG